MSEPTPDPGQMPSQYINNVFVACSPDHGVVRFTLQEVVSGGAMSVGSYTMTITQAEAFADQIKRTIAMSREAVARRKEGAN